MARTNEITTCDETHHSPDWRVTIHIVSLLPKYHSREAYIVTKVLRTPTDTVARCITESQNHQNPKMQSPQVHRPLAFRLRNLDL